MAHINKIFIMTLERCNRLPYCLGALGAKETPMELVEPVYGKDDHDYKTSRELCEDAVKDGFDGFQAILDGYHYNAHPIAYLCQRWNYMRLFRKTIESGVICMILQDDYCFHGDVGSGAYVNFWHIDDLVGHLAGLGEFKSLKFGMPDEDKKIVEERDLVEEHDVPTSVQQVANTPYFKKIVPLMVGQNDTAIIVTPEGAQWFIDAVGDFPQEINFQVSLSAIWSSDYPQPKGNWTTYDNGVRPIFSDDVSEIYMPSVVHTDTKNWQVARRVADTCDEADGTWPTTDEPGRPPINGTK